MSLWHDILCEIATFMGSKRVVLNRGVSQGRAGRPGILNWVELPITAFSPTQESAGASMCFPKIQRTAWNIFRPAINNLLHSTILSQSYADI